MNFLKGFREILKREAMYINLFTCQIMCELFLAILVTLHSRCRIKSQYKPRFAAVHTILMWPRIEETEVSRRKSVGWEPKVVYINEQRL